MKSKTTKLAVVIIVIGVLVTIGYFAFISSPLGIIMRGNPNAGRWEDDLLNWNRAFGQQPPADVSVVHSYYWTSDHFTTEFIYFFEVKTSPQWREAFLKDRNAEPVAASNARCFEVHYDGTPAWFVPTPVENYDVWDRPGYHGSIWMNKTSEHLYFYGVKL